MWDAAGDPSGSRGCSAAAGGRCYLPCLSCREAPAGGVGPVLHKCQSQAAHCLRGPMTYPQWWTGSAADRHSTAVPAAWPSQVTGMAATFGMPAHCAYWRCHAAGCAAAMHQSMLALDPCQLNRAGVGSTEPQRQQRLPQASTPLETAPHSHHLGCIAAPAFNKMQTAEAHATV